MEIILMALSWLIMWQMHRISNLEARADALEQSIEATDLDVDELWEAIFPDDDDPEKEPVEDAPSNVIAFGRINRAA